MDQLHSTTIEHKKGQHLTFEERVWIQVRLKDGWKANRIAKEIGCAPMDFSSKMFDLLLQFAENNKEELEL